MKKTEKIYYVEKHFIQIEEFKTKKEAEKEVDRLADNEKYSNVRILGMTTRAI